MKKILSILLYFFVSAVSFGQTKLQAQAIFDTLFPIQNNKAITPTKLRVGMNLILDYAEPSNFTSGSIELNKIKTLGGNEGQIPKISQGQLIWANDATGGGGASTISGISGLQDSLSKKVNLVFGKGLSTNDFTNSLKAKLDAIAAGATANSPDAFLLGRGNHTGVMPLSGISTTGGTDGQILKIVGGSLAWANDATGGGGTVSGLTTVTNISALRTTTGTANQMVQTLGYYTANDGGGWAYIWNPTSTASDDGGSVIAVSGVATGRWEFVWLNYMNSKHWGAKGDNVADETTHLQKGINYVVNKNSGGTFEIMSGVFKITAQLKAGTTTPPSNPYIESSWTIKGVGISTNPYNPDPVTFANPGTQIRLYGTGHTAILSIEKGASRFIKLESMSLVCNTVGGAVSGVLWPTSWFSQHNVKWVYCIDSQYAFNQQKGDGANGEFTHFEDCGGYTTIGFYKTNAGQAFKPYFERCTAMVNDGGEVFEIGGTDLGYGIDVVNFNFTGFDGGGINTNWNTLTGITLLDNYGISGTVNFKGGRMEHLSTLVKNRLGTYNQVGKITIEGVDFDGMTSLPARPSIISTGNAGNTDVLIRDCVFTPYLGKNAEFTIDLADNDNGTYQIENCTFGDFYSEKIKGSYSENSEIIIDGFRKHPNTGEKVKFSKRLTNSNNGALMKRGITNEHVMGSYGIPSNLLKYSDFGTGTTAPSPWTHFGSFSTFVDNRKFGHPLFDFATTPEASTIIFNNLSGVYQDVSDVTFSTGNNTAYYQAVVSFVQSANSKVKFSLENSVSGKVYDQVILTGLATDKLQTVVSLKAQDVNTTGVLRVKIENMSAQLAQVNFTYQFVTKRANGSFIHTDATVKNYTTHWTTTDAQRILGRFALPAKTDATGSAATTLPDLDNGDMYVSTTTGNLKYYANGKWNEVPGQDFGTAAPTAGTWVKGFIRNNSNKSELGTTGSKYLIDGWECITAGTPGTWIQRRVLTGN